jgi:hypothetical protein
MQTSACISSLRMQEQLWKNIWQVCAHAEGKILEWKQGKTWSVG